MAQEECEKKAFSGQGNDFMRSKLVHKNTLATESRVKLNLENKQWIELVYKCMGGKEYQYYSSHVFERY